MSNLIISGIRWQIHNFKKSFLQFEKLPFNDFFPAKTIAAIIANTPHKRTSVFSPLITLFSDKRASSKEEMGPRQSAVTESIPS